MLFLFYKVHWSIGFKFKQNSEYLMEQVAQLTNLILGVIQFQIGHCMAVDAKIYPYIIYAIQELQLRQVHLLLLHNSGKEHG